MPWPAAKVPAQALARTTAVAASDKTPAAASMPAQTAPAETYGVPGLWTLTTGPSQITLYLSPEAVTEINTLAAAGQSLATFIANACNVGSQLASGNADAQTGLQICAFSSQAAGVGIAVADDLFKLTVAPSDSSTLNINTARGISVSFAGTPVGISIPDVGFSIPGTPIGF